jgi:phosphatidylserine decarboxylase
MVNIVRSMSQMEKVNFLLTNRIPRRYLTLFMGWYSKVDNRLLTRASIYIWRLFTNELNLSEAKKQEFASLHDCFIRELKPGARRIEEDKSIAVSPCDAIVGACGDIDGTTVYQAKGFPYELGELVHDNTLIDKYRNGVYVTLRLKSSMYHHFHAPVDCKVSHINYFSGDTWNVNPIALQRIEKLYCKNEHAIVDLKIEDDKKGIMLVPVAAILVASMKFNCLPDALDLNYQGPNTIACEGRYKKGEEMGYFQHGSTIIVFATSAYSLHKNISSGYRVSMGQALLEERYSPLIDS